VRSLREQAAPLKPCKGTIAHLGWEVCWSAQSVVVWAFSAVCRGVMFRQVDCSEPLVRGDQREQLIMRCWSGCRAGA